MSSDLPPKRRLRRPGSRKVFRANALSSRALTTIGAAAGRPPVPSRAAFVRGAQLPALVGEALLESALEFPEGVLVPELAPLPLLPRPLDEHHEALTKADDPDRLLAAHEEPRDRSHAVSIGPTRAVQHDIRAAIGVV